jgi:hypothetical protein
MHLLLSDARSQRPLFGVGAGRSNFEDMFTADANDRRPLPASPAAELQEWPAYGRSVVRLPVTAAGCRRRLPVRSELFTWPARIEPMHLPEPQCREKRDLLRDRQGGEAAMQSR